MTDNATHDPDCGDSIPLTRRRTLAGLGLAGLVGLGGFSTGQELDDQERVRARNTWTARRRSKYAWYSDARYRLSTDSSTEASQLAQNNVPLLSVDVISTLDYVGASWHPYANPVADPDRSGAWQHTFVLSNFGISQVLFTPLVAQALSRSYDSTFQDLEVTLDDGDPIVTGPPPRYAPIDVGLTPGVSVQTSGPKNDQGRVDELAVSARRDPDLFSFVDPELLYEMFALQTEHRLPPVEGSYGPHWGRLDALGDKIALTGADEYSDGAQLQRKLHRARQRVDGDDSDQGTGDLPTSLRVKNTRAAVQNLLGLAVETDKAWHGGEASNKYTAASGKLLKRIGQLDFIVKVVEAGIELADQPRPVDKGEMRFFDGFKQDLPGESGSVGSSAVMFDVYVPPSEEGTVEITSRMDVKGPLPQGNDLLEGAGFRPVTMEPSWEVDVAAPDTPDPAQAERSEVLSARVNSSSFPTADDTGDDSKTGPVEKPTRGIAYEKRPRRPTPSIGAGAGVSIEHEQRDDEEQTVWNVSSDTDVTFDAYHTLRCGSAITNYRWELVRYTSSSETVVGQSNGPDRQEFSSHIPSLDSSDGLRVRLGVEDGDVDEAVWTERDLVVNPEPPVAAVETAFDEPLAGQQLTFDGSASSTPTGTIEHHAWEVTEMPDSVREEIDGAPEYVWSDSGATFSFAPHESGDYAVSLAVTDSRGYVRSDTVSFTVGTAPASARIEPAFERPIAEETVSFDGSSSTLPGGSVASYEWSVASTPDGVTVAPDDTSGQTFGFTPSSAGTYEVQLTVTGGERSDSSTHEFDVAPPASQRSCGGEPVDSTATVDGRTVCDVDGDGLYQDVNADGTVTHVDVREFFSVQHRATWKRPELFDFNGNEVVGHGDVLAMFEDVATGSL